MSPWLTPVIVLAAIAATLRLATSDTSIATAFRPAPPTCGDSLRVATTPEQPRQGTLFTVAVAGAPNGARLEGTVAGERLHFAADSTGVQWALAAAPVDAPAVAVAVSCTIADGPALPVADSVVLAQGNYPLERLTVAPRFSAPPDSALAARMRREAARAAAVSRASHDTPRLWTEAFTPPRSSRITSVYGSGRQFNGRVTSRHMGTDYAGAVGAPILAANRGVVRLVDAFFLGGNVVYVDHGQGLVTAYLHLSEHAVAAGDTVERGDVLGKVGATGRVTGPHLHFIARYGAISVDPISLLEVTAEEPVENGAEGGATSPRE